jgi:isopentenyl-diphosphate delta-isomerase
MIADVLPSRGPDREEKMDPAESAEEIILVDKEDNPVGSENKLRAHQGEGRLHRAFSIFIFDREGRVLLQRRAAGKYHFAGLWTNACCGHPRWGENLHVAAHRRLKEELGFDTALEKSFSFLYHASDEKSGLSEREFDHVFRGRYDGEPEPNPEEVGAWRWEEPREVLDDLERDPASYTPWFRIVAPRVLEEI